jgi:hypothetical protein
MAAIAVDTATMSQARCIRGFYVRPFLRGLALIFFCAMVGRYSILITRTHDMNLRQLTPIGRISGLVLARVLRTPGTLVFPTSAR